LQGWNSCCIRTEPLLIIDIKVHFNKQRPNNLRKAYFFSKFWLILCKPISGQAITNDATRLPSAQLLQIPMYLLAIYLKYGYTPVYFECCTIFYLVYYRNLFVLKILSVSSTKKRKLQKGIVCFS
jgi:hypothetical protein